MLTVALILYMAAAYRYRGGWHPWTQRDQPRWLELLAVSWPAGGATGLLVLRVGDGGVFATGAGLLVLLLTFGAHSLGHGNAMNLGRRPYQGTERAEVWDLFAGPCVVGTGYRDRWRRDALALALSGLVPMFPLAMAAGLTGRPLTAALCLAVGAGKVAAYEIGWRMHVEGSRWRQGTEIGEWLFGALLGLGVAATI